MKLKFTDRNNKLIISQKENDIMKWPNKQQR